MTQIISSVLIVEDDEDTLEILNIVLSSYFDCTGVTSRDGALALLQTGYQPSCVLMDYNMAGMSLASFLEETRQFNLKIVLTTGNGQAAKIAATLRFKYIVQKPVEVDLLVSTLKEATGSGHTPPLPKTMCVN